jgi:hypothetical protein
MVTDHMLALSERVNGSNGMITGIEVTDVPAERHAAYNKSTKGKGRKAEYQKVAGKWDTRKYLSREFVALDGEAITDSNGNSVYSYLALSTGESVRDDSGLGTLQVLNFLFQHLAKRTNSTVIGFGLSYDYNNWVSDLPEESLRQLYDSTYRDAGTEFGLYTLRWNGRSFSIRNIFGLTVTIYDVWAFFQSPFVEAVTRYLDIDPYRLELLTQGKAKRHRFTVEDMPYIIEYNRLELALLVELMQTYRAKADAVGLRPSRWTSPGAMAKRLFRQHEIKQHMAKIPEDVAEAGRYAHSGGRFEIIKYGTVSNRPSYQYDINSAYSEAISQLPSLSGGEWSHHEGDPGGHHFALYHVRTSARNTYTPSPIPVRGRHGSITYPVNVETWIWSPEMEAVRTWAERMRGQYVVEEAFVFQPATDYRPFHWVPDLYAKRAALKRNNDSAEQIVKLTLNSMWGSLGQIVGWLPEDRTHPVTIPSYHQLEWAGWVTSYIRAKMYRAALENPASVIAFETDALFTDEPLENLVIGDGLGEWKMTEYASLTYVQSGTYFGTTAQGEEVAKLRGFDPEVITREMVEKALTWDQEHRQIDAEQDRFIGAGIALQYPDLKGWRTWIKEKRTLRVYPVGKRIHGVCGCDVHRGPLIPNYWHQTLCPLFEGKPHQFVVPWINPDPEMEKYTELRNISRTDVE